jgi:hypothetical protein
VVDELLHLPQTRHHLAADDPRLVGDHLTGGGHDVVDGGVVDALDEADQSEHVVLLVRCCGGWCWRIRIGVRQISRPTVWPS